MEYNEEKISKYTQKKIKIKNITRNILILIFVIICVFNFIFSPIIQDKTNLYFFVIISGSMRPELKENDAIIVKKINFNKLKINDIISYNNNGTVVTHRIVEIYTDEGIVYTKGDSNENIDWNKVEKEQIYGKVVLKIPYIGKILNFLYNGNKYFILIFLTYIIFEINSRKKEKRKKKRKKYEIKQKRNII